MMMGTSDEIGGGGGGGGGPANFLFENQTWASVFSSINSDNSGGVCSTEELHKTTTSITSKKLIDSTSTSPTLTPTPTPTPTPTAVTPPELVVAQTTSTGHQKRSRGGAKSSTGKGTSGGGDWNECKVGGESDHEIHIWTERERRKKMRNMFSNLHALLPQLPAKADKSTIVDEAVNYIKTLQHSLQKLQKQRLEMLRGGGGGGTTLTTPTVIDYEPSSSSLVVASNSPTSNTREAFLADQAGPSSASLNNNSSSSMINDNMTFSSSAPNNSLSVVPCINSIPSTFQTWSSPNVVLSVNGDDAQISVCAPRKPGLLTTCCYVLEKHKLEVVTAHVSSDCYRSMFMIHAHANGACDQFPEPLPVEEIYKLAVGEMIFWLNS